MYDAVIRWDALGRFSRGRLPGKFLPTEPPGLPIRIDDQNRPEPGDVWPIPFLDDGVSYLVQIVRKLPGFLKGVDFTSFTHLRSVPWEVGRYKTCFIGPYSYLFRVLDVLYDDGDGDSNGSDSDDSDFVNATPQSDRAISTLSLQTPDGGPPGPTSLFPSPNLSASGLQPFTNNSLCQWSGDGCSSGSNIFACGKARTRGEYTERPHIHRDDSSTQVHSSPILGGTPREGFLFAGSFGVAPEFHLSELVPEISPERHYKNLRDSGFGVDESPSPAIAPPRASAQTSTIPLSPLVGAYTNVHFPEISTCVTSCPVRQCPRSFQDPIGTPRRARFLPLDSNQERNGSPPPTSASGPSGLILPQVRAISRSPAFHRTNRTTPIGSPSVGASPYDRKYTANLVSDEEEQYMLRSSSGRIYPSSMYGPTRPRDLFSSTIDTSPRKEMVVPPGANRFTSGIDLSVQKRILALLQASKPPQSRAPRSPPFFSRLPTTPAPKASPIIESPKPQISAQGYSWVVKHLEELAESDNNSDEDVDFYVQSLKTKFTRDFVNNTEPKPEVCVEEGFSPGLDRFLAERRLMSPELVLASEDHIFHDSKGPRYDKTGVVRVELENNDKDRTGREQQLDSDSDCDDGLFDDFPVCEMSIAMGLHSPSRYRANKCVYS